MEEKNIGDKTSARPKIPPSGDYFRITYVDKAGVAHTDRISNADAWKGYQGQQFATLEAYIMQGPARHKAEAAIERAKKYTAKAEEAAAAVKGV